MRGIKRAVFFARVAIIDKNDHAPVLGSANDSSRRLQHGIHTGIGVGIIISALGSVFEIIADDVSLCRKTGESDTDDQRADQPASRQVNAFRKSSAEDAKSNSESPDVVLEEGKKLFRT